MKNKPFCSSRLLPSAFPSPINFVLIKIILLKEVLQLRVGYICADPGIPVFGQKGCSIHVQEVIRSFLEKNVEVSLFTTRLGEEIPPDFQQVKVYPLPTIPKVERAVRERVARSINPDLELELSLAQPFDFIYERYSLWSYSGMEYARQKGIPGILEVNAPLILEQEKHRGLVDKAAAEAIAQRVFEAASTIIAVSREVKEYVSQYVRDREKIKVIPNGVNPQRFKLNLSGKDSRQFTVGFVGSLKPWHGLPILIEAFAGFYRQHPQARLLIVGDGTERDRLYCHLQQLSLVYHTKARGGDLIVRISSDANRLQEILLTAALPLIISILTLVGTIAAMFWIDRDRFYLLDLDLYCQGNPNLDIGNFIAHITEYGLRTFGNGNALKEQEIALEKEFLNLTQQPDNNAIQGYITSTLVRHIYLSNIFPERRFITEALLNLCEELLKQILILQHL
jgi:glycosyltransferase involved in cell wall biosynthesis